MNNYSKFKLILILSSFIICFAFGLDVYIPILPQMTKLFNTTPYMTHLTMSAFLLSIAVGQLFIGPISDQIGRQKVLIGSAFLFAIASAACILSKDIYWLISMRILSGIGACGMLVTAFAVVRDIFSHEESAKMYSFLNGATGTSPTFAPILGGYLYSYFGWQSVFLALSVFGIWAFILSTKFVKETLEPSRRVKVNGQIFKRYFHILKNRQFLTFTTIAGLSQAVFFGFFSISPYIIIELLEISPQQFGYYFAFFGLVLCAGGFISGKLIEKTGLMNALAIGLIIEMIGGLMMLSWSIAAPVSLLNFLLPMVVACSGAIVLCGGALSLAVEPFKDFAGTASAAFGSIEFGICSLMGSLVMLFSTASLIPYATLIIGSALFSGILFSHHLISSKEAVIKT